MAICIPWTEKSKTWKWHPKFWSECDNESGTQRFRGLPAKFTLIQDDPAKTSSGTQRDSRSWPWCSFSHQSGHRHHIPPVNSCAYDQLLEIREKRNCNTWEQLQSILISNKATLSPWPQAKGAASATLKSINTQTTSQSVHKRSSPIWPPEPLPPPCLPIQLLLQQIQILLLPIENDGILIHVDLEGERMTCPR